MTSDMGGNVVSEGGNEFGLALETLFAGPHRDKLIAQAFGITPRMVRYLRRGKHWTLERKAQLDALLDNAKRLVPEPALSNQALMERLGEIERQYAELQRQLAELRSLHYYG